MTSISTAPARVTTCAECGTELPPNALACPACRAFVHAETLKGLAAEAERRTGAGELAAACEAWRNALALLPRGSKQAVVIEAKVAELHSRLATAPAPSAPKAPDGRPWYKRGLAGLAALFLMLLGKLKFLLLGLTKASTFFSMFAFMGVYWTMYGWALAVGFALSIYVHEMGHVATIKRLGLDAGTPMFIPGIGALIRLRQHVSDPVVDARIGLAGPVWGLGAGLVSYGAYLVTGSGVWGALAALTGFINLFNLMPVWQLDGARGFHALSTMQRWLIVAVVAAAYAATEQKMLIFVGLVALIRAVQRTPVPGDRRAFVTFMLLVVALAWLSGVHRVTI